MATNRKFNVRHGLSAGAGSTLKDVVTNEGVLIDVGSLSSLETSSKTTIIDALNEVNTIATDSAQALRSTGEPNGFEDRTHSVISFQNSIRTFQVAPNSAQGHSSYFVWAGGVRREILTNETLVLPSTTGIYYVYFNSLGVLSYRTDYFNFKTDTPVAYVYWNATTSSAELVGDLRHDATLDWSTHQYLHETFGVVVSKGFDLQSYTLEGDGSLDSHAQLSLGNGTLHNEDIIVTIIHDASPTYGAFEQVLQGPAEIPVIYQSGATGVWTVDGATVYPVKTSGTTIQYNYNNAGAWSTVPITSGWYMTTWLVVSTNLEYPVFSILGQSQYATQGEAEASDFDSLDLTNLPIQDFKPIWKLIWRSDASYPNSPNAVLLNAIDLRSTVGKGVGDHGLLTGLEDDDHLQYLHVSNTRGSISADLITSGVLQTTDTSQESISTLGGAYIAEKLGIGTSTPSVELEVDGDAKVDSLGLLGNNTYRTFINSGLGLSNDITYTLPSNYGVNGQTIVSDGDGNLSWGSSYFAGSTSIVVSAADGDDNNDGSLLPVRTIKKACQIAANKPKPICIFIKAGDYTEQNPIVVPDDVSLVGDSLRSVIIRPAVAKADIFRLRNGSYLTGLTFRDALDQNGVPDFTWRYIVAFDDPFDTSVSRAGYTGLPSTRPKITRSPYIQNCSIISFLGGSGVIVDGSKVVTPNVPDIPEEVERPVVGDLPEQGKSIVANAFTMLSFGGTGWRVVNDGYTQVVSCFQIFCKNGTYCQGGGYASITNSATNHGLYALRSQGYRAESFAFDRGYISALSIVDNKQTLEVLGTGREVINHYILKFYNTGTNTEITSQFKQTPIEKTFDPTIDVNYTTNVITYNNHGYINRQQVIYSANGGIEITGLFDETVYYVNVIDANTFKLFDDEELSSEADLEPGTYSQAHKLITNLEEFFVDGVIEYHNFYQDLTLSAGSYTFTKGEVVIGTSLTATSSGTVWNWDPATNKLTLSINKVLVAGQQVRQQFTNGMTLQDHSVTPVTATVNTNFRREDLYTTTFKTSSTSPGNSIQNFENLEGKDIRLHRPSIVNSSSHTWEYAGSGMDYNALPQNGARTIPAYEQFQNLPGRVYSSGTNELGDFKIGDSIVAENRTGNIFFKQTVTVGELSSLKLTISDITIEEISTDVGLGDNEVGGATNSRLSTQFAIRGFLDQKLGAFQGKTVSTNSIPGSVVQLNSSGKINVDLIPAVRTFNTYKFEGQDSRLEAYLDVPPIEVLAGDFVTESVSGSDTTYVLQSDDISQYVVIDPAANINLTGITQIHGVISNADGQIDTSFGTNGLVSGIVNNTNITNGGSGYTPSTGTITYKNVTLTNVSVSGTPSGAKADILVTDGVVTLVDMTRGGSGYAVGDILSANPASIGGTGSGFQLTVTGVEKRLYIDLIGEKRKFVASSIAPDFISDASSPSQSVTNTFSSVISFNAEASPTGAVDSVNDRFVLPSHGYSNSDLVFYDSGVNLPVGGLLSETSYYVKVIDSNTIELYTSYDLASNNKVSISATSTGTHSFTIYAISTDKDTFYLPSHGYATGDAVRITGASLPSGLFSGNYYFIGSITTNTFTLHESKSAALDSVNGITNSEVNLTTRGTGTTTLKSLDVRIIGALNTSCKESDNWSFLSGANIDASNIVSGTIATTRLASSGTANSDTFLRGDQEWAYAVQSVYVDPAGSNGLQLSNGGTHLITGGITAYHGNVKLEIDNVNGTESRTAGFTNIGVAAFNTEQFNVSVVGDVSVKNGVIDAGTLDGQDSTYYLDPSNLISAIPVDRGGTGHSSYTNGQLLIGNSSNTLTKATLTPTTNQTTITNGSGSVTVGLAANVSTSRFTSTVATGTSPLTVTSTTLCANLNADLLDNQQGTYYLNYANFTNTPDLTKTLTLNTSGVGLSGSATYSANTANNITFTVTSNATAVNTASTIVARDGSGNFAAGTITANLTGTASLVGITNDTTTNTTHYIHFGDATSGGDGVKVSSTKLVFNPSSGNLGIGLTGPSEKLHVSGNAIITGNLTVDTNTFYVDATNNRVGVGTTTPSTTSGVIADLRGSVLVGSNTSTQLTVGSGQIIQTGANLTLFGGSTSGSSILLTNNGLIAIKPGANTATELYYGTSSKVLETTSTGVSVLGAASVSGNLTVDTNTLHVDSTNNRVGVGTTTPGYALEVAGSFAATTKSFIIDHPTKPDHKLRYGSLEGPENGIYVRGRSKEFVIELPEYWTKLIDPDSITVNLTPIGKTQTLWVKDIRDNKIFIGSKCSEINYFYMVLAERADVDKLEVEIPLD